jgi:hypothetical protein
MTSTRGKLFRATALLLLAAAAAAPVSAQIGGLKKKVRAAAGAPAPAEQGGRPVAAAGTGGEVLVLDDEVLDRLVAGIRAGQAERAAAAKSDTPYGRYNRAAAAYEEAKLKCDAAAQTHYQRMAASPAMMEKNNAYLEKMMAAMERQDTAAQRMWGDSMAALQDPSCTVKMPEKPGDYFDHQSAMEAQAEKKELETSGFDRRELGQVRDRVIAIIQDAPPPDVSPSEKEAVDKREAQLKQLMGLEPPPAAPAPKPAPPAAAAAPPPAAPSATPAQAAMGDCMAKNSEKHKKEIERLSEKLNAASEAGNTAELMALADSLQRLQMAGCQ